VEIIEAKNQQPLRILLGGMGLLTTIATWLFHLHILPWLFTQHGPLEDIVFILVLAAPFLTVLSIEYSLWPAAFEPDARDSGPMSGYLQLQRYDNRRKFFLTAAMLSALNLACLMYFSSRHG
jgi:hypothetical protein